MITRWAMTADQELNTYLDYLKSIPYEARLRDERLRALIPKLKAAWSRGTKIERLAVLGWQDNEVLALIASMIDKLDQLRADYQEELAKKGSLPPLNDRDLQKYETVSRQHSKLNEFKKNI
jgi:hypothetical protein